MNQTTFNTIEKNLRDAANAIVLAKRPDYTQDRDDVLDNFRASAEEAGITMKQVWLVHFYKQYSAIARLVKNPTATPSESIESRFADLLNYTILGYAIFNDASVKTPNLHPETAPTTPVSPDFRVDPYDLGAIK